jgi:probable phosphoglycerate mutase
MSHLERTLAVEDWAFLEFHARLAVLFPDHVVCHMPARAMRGAPREDRDGDEIEDEEERPPSSDEGPSSDLPPKRSHRPSDASSSFRCDAFVANAATCGDRFAWHVDCDPSSLPSDSAFAAAYGDYVNGERNKPLLVSAIVYLNAEWRREWDGETVFLDGASDVGAVVAPRPGRLVLMHQDVWHKISPPSADAKRPRYSLVWKLALTPKKNDEKARERGAAASSTRERSTIARPEFGQISSLGSAARLREVFAAIRRRERRDADDARGVGGEPAARSAKRTREEEKEGANRGAAAQTRRGMNV